MGAYYDEIEIEDMVWDAEKRVYHYPCPCGDRFEISRKQLADYEDIATCPSCSLIIRVIYDPVRLSVLFEVPSADEDSSLITKTTKRRRKRKMERKNPRRRAVAMSLRMLWRSLQSLIMLRRRIIDHSHLSAMYP